MTDTTTDTAADTAADTPTQAELWQRTFDAVPRVMREQGCTEEQIAKHLQDLQHGKAVADRLEELGLVVRSRKHLLRMSNVIFRCGQLYDGTCHYQWQTTIGGNTYPHRDRLRAAGYRWDAQAKVWAKPMEGRSIAEHITDAREMVVAW